MKKLIAHLVWDDQGQDLIEYVLIGSLVSVAVVVAAGNLGTNLNSWYQAIATWAGVQAANPNLAVGS
jgi:pilus assembly protein Flp/PilA